MQACLPMETLYYYIPLSLKMKGMDATRPRKCFISLHVKRSTQCSLGSSVEDSWFISQMSLLNMDGVVSLVAGSSVQARWGSHCSQSWSVPSGRAELSCCMKPLVHKYNLSLIRQQKKDNNWQIHFSTAMLHCLTLLRSLDGNWWGKVHSCYAG